MLLNIYFKFQERMIYSIQQDNENLKKFIDDKNHLSSSNTSLNNSSKLSSLSPPNSSISVNLIDFLKEED